MEDLSIWNNTYLVKPYHLGNVMARGLFLRLIWNYTLSTVNVHVIASDEDFFGPWNLLNVFPRSGVRSLNPGAIYTFMGRDLHTEARLQLEITKFFIWFQTSIKHMCSLHVLYYFPLEG